MATRDLQPCGQVVLQPSGAAAQQGCEAAVCDVLRVALWHGAKAVGCDFWRCHHIVCGLWVEGAEGIPNALKRPWMDRLKAYVPPVGSAIAVLHLSEVDDCLRHALQLARHRLACASQIEPTRDSRVHGGRALRG